jgi:hypothetical protein
MKSPLLIIGMNKTSNLMKEIESLSISKNLERIKENYFLCKSSIEKSLNDLSTFLLENV